MTDDTLSDSTAPVDETAAADLPVSSLVDQVEIPIRFGLGDLSMPLRDFQAIQPGFVFRLDRAPNNPVVIEVNGTTIGHGELVLIEGRLAVQLNEVADDGFEPA